MDNKTKIRGISPKSKEGCRVNAKQAKLLNAILFNGIVLKAPPKTYTMIKRLVLLPIKKRKKHKLWAINFAKYLYQKKQNDVRV